MPRCMEVLQSYNRDICYLFNLKKSIPGSISQYSSNININTGLGIRCQLFWVFTLLGTENSSQITNQGRKSQSVFISSSTSNNLGGILTSVLSSWEIRLDFLLMAMEEWGPSVLVLLYRAFGKVYSREYALFKPWGLRVYETARPGRMKSHGKGTTVIHKARTRTTFATRHVKCPQEFSSLFRRLDHPFTFTLQIENRYSPGRYFRRGMLLEWNSLEQQVSHKHRDLLWAMQIPPFRDSSLKIQLFRSVGRMNWEIIKTKIVNWCLTHSAPASAK